MMKLIGGRFQRPTEGLSVVGDREGTTFAITDGKGNEYDGIVLSKNDTIQLLALLEEIVKHQRSQVDPR